MHLYVLADKCDVLKLKDNICRLLYDGHTTQGRDVAKDAVSYAYENPSKYPMRRRIMQDAVTLADG